MKDETLVSSVRGLIEDFLRGGAAIEIDGVGTLELDANGELTFNRNGKPQVFLAYAQEDRLLVQQLYADLHTAGFEPWMDSENLLPGQNWPRAIERAIELSDYFVACFSSRSAKRRGHFHSELSYALDVARRVPVDHAYFLPLRLDECQLPVQVEKQVHYVDLWPDWGRGLELLMRALRSHEKKRKKQLER